MELPLVSVIVHTKNSKRTLRKHLESIRAQSYKSIEIIAVDNFSSDGTFEMLQKYTKYVYTYGPERSAQRNFGVEKARGKYVLILDSDMILTPDVISQCVNLLNSDKKIKAIIIPEKSIGEGFWADCKSLERACYVGDEAIEAARFFEREAFLRFGGYDEKITGPEDWDLPLRMRKAEIMTGRISAYILHDEGKLKLSEVVRKKYYYGKSLSSYFKKHPFCKHFSQTAYFLRPAFYRNWRLLARHPYLTMGMIVMLFLQQIAGFLGYMQGTFFKESKT
jgi:glycosyltransferase involved in cell wall biosynthesis